MLRRYTTSDFEQLIQLFLLNTPAYFHEQEQQDLEEYLHTEIEDYFVIEQEGPIVACGECNVEDNTGWLSWYIVHPAYHGKGLGRLLANHSIDVLKANVRVKAIVVRTSQFVYPFYEKLGFKLTRTQDDYWAPGYHLFHMELL
ncbi:MAG: GNAT family N-acetyltransferase [Sphingobacteriales bacterium]|nr:MAG: GNAT family N-acetyltransferase [Sphingobacteriales bacterium]